MSARKRKNVPVLDMFDDNGEQFDRGLRCHVNAIAYDINRRTGYVTMPEGECVDMTGAIQLFKDIDPNVAVVFAGDMTYIKAGAKWEAFYKRGGRTFIKCASGNPNEVHPFFTGGEQS